MDFEIDTKLRRDYAALRHQMPRLQDDLAEARAAVDRRDRDIEQRNQLLLEARNALERVQADLFRKSDDLAAQAAHDSILARNVETLSSSLERSEAGRRQLETRFRELSNYLLELEERVAELEDGERELLQRAQGRERDVVDLEAVIDRLRVRNSELETQVRRQAEAEAALESQVAGRDARLTGLVQQVERLEGELRGERERSRHFEARLASAQETANGLRADLAVVEGDAEGAHRLVREQRRALGTVEETLTGELVRKDAEIGRLNALIDGLESTLGACAARADTLQAREQLGAAVVAEARGDLQRVLDENAELARTCGELQGLLGRARDELAGYRDEFGSLVGAIAEMAA